MSEFWANVIGITIVVLIFGLPVVLAAVGDWRRGNSRRRREDFRPENRRYNQQECMDLGVVIASEAAGANWGATVHIQDAMISADGKYVRGRDVVEIVRMAFPKNNVVCGMTMYEKLENKKQ